MKKETIEIITLVLSSGGIIFSAVAAIAASRSASISSKQLNTQIKEQELAVRPQLIPLSENIGVNLSKKKIFKDWHNSSNKPEYDIPISSHLIDSKCTFQVINTGKSLALDATFLFEIEGGIEYFSNYEIDSLKITIPDGNKKQLVLSNFDIRIENEAESSVSHRKIKVYSYDQFFPIVQSNESIKINIKSYFILLNNIYLSTYNKKTIPTFNRPRLIMTIHYKNQNHTNYSEKYAMELDKQSVSSIASNHSGLITFTPIK